MDIELSRMLNLKYTNYPLYEEIYGGAPCYCEICNKPMDTDEPHYRYSTKIYCEECGEIGLDDEINSLIDFGELPEDYEYDPEDYHFGWGEDYI